MDQLEIANPRELDFQDLIKLAATRSHESREAVFRTVSELLVDHGDARSKQERNLAGDILRHLLSEVAADLRRDLATRLAARNDVSEGLIHDLAMDQIDVAEAVLRQSPLLSDMTLIEIIHNKAAQHQVAIARRETLAAEVSRALVATENSDVIQTVIENPGAALAEDTYAYLVEESRNHETYQEPLIRREDLPQALAQRLYVWVSGPIREHICQRYAIDPAILEKELKGAVDDSIAGSTTQRPKPTRAQMIVHKLSEKGVLDHRFLVGALFRGNVEVFREGLIELTNLPRLIIERVVVDRDPRALAILCRLIGCDSTSFEKIFSFSRPDGDPMARPSLAERNRLRAMYDRVTIELANQIAGEWRENPDFHTGVEGTPRLPRTTH